MDTVKMLFLTLLALVSWTTCSAVIPGQNHSNNTLIWCTTSGDEQNKCEAFSRAVEREQHQFQKYYAPIKCKQAFNRDECMFWLDLEKVHLTTLDAGEVYVGGRLHSLIPIMQEVYDNSIKHQYAVAVVKKGSLTDVTHIRDLRGKKACFAGVGMLAGWVTPIYNLMRRGELEIADCNNHIKSAIKFFGWSCAVNSLVDKNNPLGDNSDQLCKLCNSTVPGHKCTNADPYAGYDGAFRCLVESGDVAFLIHTTVKQMLSSDFDFPSITKDNFELLCLDGSRKPVDDFASCHWGEVPSNAIVVSSAVTPERRFFYQKLLERAVKIFGNRPVEPLTNNEFYNNRFENRQGKGYDDQDSEYNQYDRNSENRNNYNDNNYNSWNTTGSYDRDRNLYSSTQEPNIESIDKFSLFESAPRYGRHHNLLFSDATRDFYSIEEDHQNFKDYLSDRVVDLVEAIKRCPVNKITLCVTSKPELAKCLKMKIATDSQSLKPRLNCFEGQSHIHCMKAISDRVADITVLDASDVYTAGQRYDLVPFVSEVYNLGSPDYYVVAVAREEDDNTDLTYLKNKYTCHAGINTAAGWVYPLAYLLSNTWIRGYGCDSVHAAAEYFAKSCVPGALSPEYNMGVPYDNLCDLCHGTKDRYCRRDASEDYYGHTGAIRCLVEGGGDVAFVRHTTVAESTDGKRREFWARNTFTKDFQLLCTDGTRKPTSEYRTCNLGKVKANAVVTRGGDQYNEVEIKAYAGLLIYAQQLFGRKEQDEFTFGMFYSQPPFSDLIFSDATQQLAIIPPDQRSYTEYLGRDFLRARKIVDCTAGSSALVNSFIGTLFMVVAVFILQR